MRPSAGTGYIRFVGLGTLDSAGPLCICLQKDLPHPLLLVLCAPASEYSEIDCFVDSDASPTRAHENSWERARSARGEMTTPREHRNRVPQPVEPIPFILPNPPPPNPDDPFGTPASALRPLGVDAIRQQLATIAAQSAAAREATRPQVQRRHVQRPQPQPRARPQPQTDLYKAARRPSIQLREWVAIHDAGAMDLCCPNCRALHWKDERLSVSSIATPKFGLCCKSGKIQLPLITQPPEPLQTLLIADSENARVLRANI